MLTACDDRLDTVSDHFTQVCAPTVDRAIHQTRIRDRLARCSCWILVSRHSRQGITNTLTIGSGRGEIFGAWKGIRCRATGTQSRTHGSTRQSDLDQNSSVQQSDVGPNLMQKLLEQCARGQRNDDGPHA